MRTAGRMLPSTDTWPTPDTWLIRGASSVSATSLRSRSGTLRDVRASVRTGVSAGFTFE